MKDYIDKESGIPYYRQLKQILNYKIKNGNFKDGKISSENELSDKYGISVITVRKALTQLTYEGKIYRVKGVGTFLKKPKFEVEIAKYLSLGRMIKKQGLSEKIHVIEKKVLNTNDIDTRNFEIINPSKKAVYIKRVRYINKEPVVIENNYYNNDYCHPMIDQASNSLLTDFLINKLNIRFHSINEYLQPINLSREDAQILHVEENLASLLVTKISYDKKNTWLEFSNIIIRGDKAISYIKIL